MVLIAGCGTIPDQKWNSRVGSYTVRQAVREMGRPQEAKHFSDGTQIGSWLTRPGTRGSLYYGWGSAYTGARAFDYSILPRDAPQIPDEYIRLLFGRDGKLITWDRQLK